MAKRWSKLQKQIYQLVDSSVPLRIQCIDVGRSADRGSLRRLGLYRVHLGKCLIWNFPEGFVRPAQIYPDGGDCFSYTASDINRVIREYIDTPKDQLPEKKFDRDWFGLTTILKAADRRLGRQRLMAWFKDSEDPAIVDILTLRFGNDYRIRP
jgi:hypothetical protein